MSNQGLFIGLLTSLFGIVFALPGAVVISGFISQRQNGMISLAGPVTNMIFGAICLPFIFLMELSDELSNGIYIVGFINLWLAVLNLLPIRPLDGSKLLRWNLKIYIGVFATALILLSTIFIYRIFF